MNDSGAMNDNGWWRCACGFAAYELAEHADCRCGLNPLEHGTWVRTEVGSRSCLRFVRDLGDRALTLRMLGPLDSRTEALGLYVGDLGSVCGRWTVDILIPTEDESVDVWHAGRPYRFLRRGDEIVVPWFATLMQGRPVYCVDGTLGMLMLVDAFVFVGGDPSQRVTFLVGHPFSTDGGDA